MGQLNSQLFAGRANEVGEEELPLTCGDVDPLDLRSLNSHSSHVRTGNRGLARVKKKPIFNIDIDIYTLVDPSVRRSRPSSIKAAHADTREESEFANKVDVSAGQRPFWSARQVRRKREFRCEQRSRSAHQALEQGAGLPSRVLNLRSDRGQGPAITARGPVTHSTIHALLANLEQPMTTTTIVGPCKNHPDRPASTVLTDGTLRCDPCIQEPRVTAWTVAAQDQRCRRCDGRVRIGNRLAELDTVPPTLCCEHCVEEGEL